MTENIYPYFEDPDCIMQVAEANGDEPGGKYAESKLYSLLKEQLPKDWYCLYDVGFRGVNGDNQIDFLVIVPGNGIINLECKGEGYTPLENGNKFSHNSFFQGSRNFVEKARKACENRYKTICRLWNRENIGVYTGAVIFPTFDFKDDHGTFFNFGMNPIYTEKDIKWDGKGQSPLEKIILLCFDAAKRNITKGKGFAVATLTEEDAKRIFDEYKSKGNETFHEIFNNALKNFNNTLEIAFDAASTNPLDFIFDSGPYVHITGAAGTGKTWLAQMAAERFLKKNTNARILYVCYNTMLAADLAANRFKNTNICVTNFHRLGQVLFNESCIINRTDGSNLMDENKTDENFITVWNGLSKSERPEKYDLILVDEAQDFNKTKIDFLCKIAKNTNRKIVFFSDKEQAMHETENWQLPQLGADKIPVMELKRNLRNSIQIHEYVETELIETGVEGISKAQGPVPERCSATWSDIYNALTDALGKFNKSSIALISDLSEETIKSKLGQFSFLTKASKFIDTKKDLKSWRNSNKYIWLSTIKKFKGLEADVVFVILGQKSTSKAEQYVGATRAKYCLKIFELTN